MANIRLEPNIVDTFKIEIEFNGQVYEATCAIIQLNAPNSYRCQLHYFDSLPEPFGVYRSINAPEMLEDAKTRFQLFLQKLPKGKRIPK
jgi:hypothetical protein